MACIESKESNRDWYKGEVFVIGVLPGLFSHADFWDKDFWVSISMEFHGGLAASAWVSGFWVIKYYCFWKPHCQPKRIR